MRIIGGDLKGRVLKGKVPEGVRPTTDYMREALFNILENHLDFTNAKFLDMFAGSGAIGIEAISRGFEFTYFIDKSYNSIEFIKSNLLTLNIPKEKYSITKGNASKLISSVEFNFQFDVIFCDPPYNLLDFEKLLLQISNSNILNSNGLLIAETNINDIFNYPNSFSLVKVKESGQTKITILKNA